MTDWTLFAVGVVALTLVLLVLTRRSSEALDGAHIVGVDDRRSEETHGHDGGPPRTFDHPDAIDIDFHDLDTPVENAADPFLDGEGRPSPSNSDRSEDHPVDDDEGDTAGSSPVDTSPTTDGTPPTPTLTSELLLLNVTVTQGLALSALVALAWWTDVPAAVFGVATDDVAAGVVLVGVALGVAFYFGNEVAAALGRRFGMPASERLREAMAPDDARGWAFLLVVVLPVIAVFEEALFRGALIGAFALGFGVDPWLLAVASSVLFGLGHGAQGRLGVLVTGTLGFGLAAVFVLSESLLLVIVVHYVINALEFGVREGLGWRPLGDGA